MLEVCGLETEYGLRVQVRTPYAWRAVGADEAARRLFASVVAEHGATNAFLRNGGRLYLDVGAHPEYATAECAGVDDLVAQDAAGDRILALLAARAREAALADGQQIRVSVFKNNLDAHANSYGSHENYRITRRLDLDAVGRGIAGLLVTRQLVAGAGHWAPDSFGDGRFALSQRASHVWSSLSRDTTRARPMVNTRDEPHDDPEHYRRLHVIVGDSNLFPDALRVRVASVQSVLRAIDAGEKFDDLEPVDVASAIRDAASRTDGSAAVVTTSGTRTASEIQREYWRRSGAHAGPDAAGHALWGRLLDLLEASDLAGLARHVDWAAKLALIRADAARHPDQPDRAARIDLAFHDIVAGQGLVEPLAAAGRVANLPAEETVARAVDTPPTTRATVRAAFLDAAQRHRRSYAVTWDRFTCHDLADGVVVQRDPVASSNPAVDALIERIGREPRTPGAAGGGNGLVPPVV